MNLRHNRFTYARSWRKDVLNNESYIKKIGTNNDFNSKKPDGYGIYLNAHEVL